MTVSYLFRSGGGLAMAIGDGRWSDLVVYAPRPVHLYPLWPPGVRAVFIYTPAHLRERMPSR